MYQMTVVHNYFGTMHAVTAVKNGEAYGVVVFGVQKNDGGAELHNATVKAENKFSKEWAARMGAQSLIKKPVYKRANNFELAIQDW